jgi:hypothetical protein
LSRLKQFIRIQLKAVFSAIGGDASTTGWHVRRRARDRAGYIPAFTSPGNGGMQFSTPCAISRQASNVVDINISTMAAP